SDSSDTIYAYLLLARSTRPVMILTRRLSWYLSPSMRKSLFSRTRVLIITCSSSRPFLSTTPKRRVIWRWVNTVSGLLENISKTMPLADLSLPPLRPEPDESRRDESLRDDAPPLDDPPLGDESFLGE